MIVKIPVDAQQGKVVCAPVRFLKKKLFAPEDIYHSASHIVPLESGATVFSRFQ